MRQRIVLSTQAVDWLPMRTRVQPAGCSTFPPVWLSVWMAPSSSVTFCHGAFRWMPLESVPTGLLKVVTTPIFLVPTTAMQEARKQEDGDDGEGPHDPRLQRLL